MRVRTIFLMGVVALMVGAPAIFAQTAPPAPAPPSQQPASSAPASSSVTAASVDEVIDRVLARESELSKELRKYQPRVEIYLQNMKPDAELGAVPEDDRYFFGKVDMTKGLSFRSFMPGAGLGNRALQAIAQIFTMQYLPGGFAQLILVDEGGFDRKHYDFEFVRREFLGEVRTLVFNVTPKRKAGAGRFQGRIWVEDREYNIVRFNGFHGPNRPMRNFSHFDSWRLHTGPAPGMWLPAFIYTEEAPDRFLFQSTPPFKGQVRIWGYDLKSAGRREEFTDVVVEAATPVRDISESDLNRLPVEGLRAWERQAEDNILERLEKAGLLAAESEVDKVLKTVITNLEVTNNLSLDPEVRARVLLTSPLESFTVGRTIVLSRGLIDTLPDEASLATMLAHELAHISLGHRLDTKFAFHDRMLFADQDTFRKLGFRRDPKEEEDADRKAMELLANSPYKDKLENAGLFLRAVGARASSLPGLIRPHLGNRLALNGATIRMTKVMESSPQLQLSRLEQQAPLPLGGRIRVDPWANRIELVKKKPVALLSAREKIPLEVAPFMPYLTRLGESGANGKQVTAQADPTSAPEAQAPKEAAAPAVPPPPQP